MIDIYHYIADAGLTMVSEAGVLFAMEQAVIAGRKGGVIVECGCWRGGCSIAMALAQREALGRVKAPVYALDSFEGLPPATERDGPAALAWQAASEDNCRADLSTMRHALNVFEAEQVNILPGLFARTLPWLVANIRPPIQLLRVDCDWYDSIMPCLKYLEPLVAEGGTVIVDDYYAWDGAARATHDYLSSRDLPYRLRCLPDDSAAYWIKQSAGRPA